jgi:hypothetical protein
VLRAMGDPIARALGNALIAPIVTLEPGNPERVRMPGTVLLSPETFKAVVSDMAVSLKTQGFKHIVLLGDSGGNIKPLTEAAEALNAKWKAAGSDVRAYSITEYYNYGEVEEFEKTALGIHEQMEGLHDDYYISAIIAVHDPNGVRMPERVKAGKFRDQRRQPGADREDRRERQEDHRLPHGEDGRGDQESDGGCQRVAGLGTVAYAPIAQRVFTGGRHAGIRQGFSDCRRHHSYLPPRDREQGDAVVARHREHGHRVWCGCRGGRVEDSKGARPESSPLESADEPRSSP